MSLGEALRQARERRGVTQAVAAAYVQQALRRDGFSATTISAYEADRGLPSKEVLAVLAAFYGAEDQTVAWETLRERRHRERRADRLRTRLASLENPDRLAA